jgi:chaperonin GroEL
MGSKLLKKTAGQTNTFAGDGTTSSAILTREILVAGQKAIAFQSAHPIALKRGLDIGLKVVL